MTKANKSQAKNKALFGIIAAIIMTIIGMLSVYIAGNARGYDPSLPVLLRNALLMCVFLIVYFILKPAYKGNFTMLVVVVFLTGLGFLVQYRISSAINVGFQETLVRQYSAAVLKKMQTDSLTALTTKTDTAVKTPALERSFESIQKETKQFLRLEKFKPNQLIFEFFENVPGWTRVIISYLFSLFFIVYLVKKCSSDRFMDSLSKPFFWVTLTILLLTVFVALSEVKTRGRFVYQMTPWEAFKITIIIFLAGFFAKYKEDFTRKRPKIRGQRIKRMLIPWGPFILIWLVPQLLFVLLKDFGQVIIYGGLVVVMIFVITKKYMYLFGGVAVTVFASKLILLSESFLPPHVLQRFRIWSDIWSPPHNEVWWNNVYQIMNSFFALNAGGLTGSGLGLGYPTNIPLVVSDFVYSAIGEEMGFLGAAVLVFAYFVLFLLGMRIVVETQDDFEKLLAVGFTTILAIQVFVNIGGVIKLIPLTGITLPFISRGGFSFIITFIIIGFLMGIDHRNGKRTNYP
ncbi:FtsW/RodA/SpoVE family cell cycle protein [candidate division KSB1 bacterium]|nr:FtsW/RodA/SpoVE family cell cycle protein [candidate division KSB1 bacterium]